MRHRKIYLSPLPVDELCYENTSDLEVVEHTKTPAPLTIPLTPPIEAVPSDQEEQESELEEFPELEELPEPEEPSELEEEQQVWPALYDPEVHVPKSRQFSPRGIFGRSSNVLTVLMSKWVIIIVVGFVLASGSAVAIATWLKQPPKSRIGTHSSSSAHKVYRGSAALTFSGAITGQLTNVTSVPFCGSTQRQGGSASFYGFTVQGRINQHTYFFAIALPAYTGPGTYTSSAAFVSRGGSGPLFWDNTPAFTSSVTINSDQGSGTLDTGFLSFDQQLSSSGEGTSGTVRVSGSWRCSSNLSVASLGCDLTGCCNTGKVAYLRQLAQRLQDQSGYPLLDWLQIIVSRWCGTN